MYFFDTYAIMALMEKNPNYDIFKDIKIIACVMNIGEIYNIILREKSKNAADEWFSNISFELLEITPEIIVKAVYFKHLNKKKNISSTDAVGYILSLKHNLKFLTGDRQFENLPNVEFVK
ncbi:PIN domain-containing protein [Candidatus Woesearchaeota archaeon]|nr:PIN domain-containing protein [Candidatus Woesearchaeota archaeon]